MSVKGYRRCFFAVFFGGAALPVQRLQRAAQAAYRGQHPDHNADNYDPAAQCEPMPQPDRTGNAERRRYDHRQAKLRQPYKMTCHIVKTLQRCLTSIICLNATSIQQFAEYFNSYFSRMGCILYRFHISFTIAASVNSSCPGRAGLSRMSSANSTG